MKGLYEIKNGKTRATLSEIGGTVTLFTVEGKNIFYPYREIEGKQRGGCFFCAPWFGLSAKAERKHGYLRDIRANRFSVAGNTGEFTFLNRKEENYPWLMEYVTGAAIDGEGMLEMSLEIKHWNDSMLRKAPVLPGFHPFFACKDASKVRVFLGGKKYQGFEEKSRMIPLKTRDIHIVIPGSHEIEMTLLGDFFKFKQPQMVFWTDAPEKYFCVEPIFQDQKFFETSKGFYLDQFKFLKLEVSFRVF
jgi:galactose mutarotase-like enzyme